MGAVRVQKTPRAIGPLPRIGDAHTRSDAYAGTGFSRAYVERRLGDVLPVERRRNLHRACKAGWTIEPETGVEASSRLTGANEHGVTASFSKAGHVETVVHSVDEKYVRVTFLTEKRPRAPRQANAGVAGKVLRAPIGFRFDDARQKRSSAGQLPHEKAAQKRTSYDERVASVPGTPEACGA